MRSKRMCKAAAFFLAVLLGVSSVPLESIAAQPPGAGEESQITAETVSGNVTVEALQPQTVSQNLMVLKGVQVPAWNGVEGGGRFVSGGRGKPVYHVTSLEDYLLADNSKNGEKKTHDAPVEGTLRYGIEVFALENDGANIVFDVAGNIKLLSTLTFKERSNITVAGQTAPGDGITVSGMDTNMSNSDNIIIRYIRFRPGRAYVFTDAADSIDAFWGRDNSNFIVDHCSFSWNTDETLSIYRGENGTVSNCIISESLTISGHSKGRHGYGAIWGGNNVTFTDNLIASHTSRNARIGGGYMGDPTTPNTEFYKRIATLQVSNNVIYNWGYNGTYGLGWTYTNFINNYLKPGLGTRDSVENLIINPGEADGTVGPKEAGVYVNGNVIVGFDDYSADNAKGIRLNSDPAIQAVTEIAGTPYSAEGFASLTTTTALEAYRRVLDTAGATLPRRDAIDARVIAETREDRGRFLNTEDEAGGYISPAGVITESRESGYDTDGDGMPDTYEEENGFDKNDAADGMALAATGRSNLEEYLITVTDEEYVPSNPEVSLSLQNNAQFFVGEAIDVKADASSNSGIEKVELYNGSTLIGVKSEAPYDFTIEGLNNGTYNISVRAYDTDGDATQSTAAVIHVNNPSVPAEWTSLDIGNPGVAGSASYGTETINGVTVENVLTVKGAGKLGKSEGNVTGRPWSDAATDDFQYTYRAFSGDGEIVAKIEEVSTVDNHAFTGIMFREKLTRDSKAVAAGLSFVKYTNTTWSALLASRAAEGGAMSDLTETIDSASSAAMAGIPLVADIPFRVQRDKQSITQGTWIKLVRQGNTFTAYTSQDNADWTLIGSKDVEMAEDIYVGFAVDGNKAANNLDNLSWAQFTNISIKNDLHSVTGEFTHVSVQGLATTVANGDDLSITLTAENGYQLPESVTVTVDGAAVEAEYDFATGKLVIRNITGDVVIRAEGIEKAPAPREAYEIINTNEAFGLQVTEADGIMTLTQEAVKGSMADSNISYLVFPATADEGTISLKLKIKSFNYLKGSGVFVGAFMPDNAAGSRYFMSLGFRNPEQENANSLSPYWWKAAKIGNGGSKRILQKDTEYEVEITWDSKEQMTVNWNIPANETASAVAESLTQTFKLSDCHADLYDHVNEDNSQYTAERRFGLAISGAVAEIRDFTYYNSQGEELYNQNSNAVLEAPEVGTLNNPVVGQDGRSISVSWTGKETLADGEKYAIEVTKDGKIRKKLTTTQNHYSLSVKNDGTDNGEYVFKVYGVKGAATTTAQTVGITFAATGEEPEPQAARKIEVWDFGAVQEADETLFHNNITDEVWTATGLVGADGTLDSTVNTSKRAVFGMLTMQYQNGDKLYGSIHDGAFKDYNVTQYPDGYTSNGLWYCNGKGGTGSRYVLIDDVKAGDRIVAYMGSHTVEEDEVHFLYKGAQGEQDDTAHIGNKKCGKYEFIAEYDGAYQIYVGSSTNVKPIWHRIMLIPAVEVSGTVNVGETDIKDYGVKFINDTTEAEIEAVVSENGFQAVLAPGYEYTAVLTGAAGFGFTNATKTVSVPTSAVKGGLTGIVLAVESKDVQLFEGMVKGFDASADLSKVKVVLKAEDPQKEDVTFKPQNDGSFSVYLESGVTYTITLEGANDYRIAGEAQICLNAPETRDITISPKTVYAVKGELLGLDSGAEVTALTFVNMEDGYVYAASLENGGYSIGLRNGVYVVEAQATGYKTISHITVKDGAVDRDLLFTSTAAIQAIPFASDIYVGYPERDNNYATVRDAVAACKAMRLSNADDRITVHIAPGTYREQVIVDVPYVTFQNDEPQKEVKLSWYYGIGYEYYSIGADGYYSEAAAFDKFDKNTAQKWGAATYIKGAAKEFRAEYITFESSFNKYMTDEELADGVAPGGADKKDFVREADTDVCSREATERATALAVEGDWSEFYHCRVVGSQDTLYTGNNIKAYFKNCYIDGNTDYIFGGGDFVFDGCELSFYGYSNQQAGGYLTAAADGSTHGYIFRNCCISANEEWTVEPGCFGRPWRASARAAFINTKLQNAEVILPAGWKDMSGNQPEDANYKEFNTTFADKTAVDVSGRTPGTVQSDNPYPDMRIVFGDWTPAYYTRESEKIALTEPVKITADTAGSVGAGNVLTVQFSLGENEGANVSVIQWYRVGEDGTEALVKTAYAQFDRTYTVTKEDEGADLKVVVMPETVGGYVMEAQWAVFETAVEEEKKEIVSLSNPDDVTVTTEEAKDLKHPGKVTATLSDQTTLIVTIDAKTWKAEPEFDAAREGKYVWTADITAPEGCTNGRRLTVSYTMTVKAAVLDKFEDLVEGEWYVSAVQYVYNHGYMNGKSGNTFDPQQNLARGEFATVLYSMAGKPAAAYKDNFPDVKEGDWYTSPVMWAYENEIVRGYDTGYFGTFDNISREQIALMLYKYAKLQGYDLSITEDAMNDFTDYEMVSEWAADAVNWAVSRGIMSGKPNGDGTYSLAPLENAKRCECAAMIRSMMKNVTDK